MIDIEKFLFVYQGKYGTLKDDRFTGLSDLIKFINADDNINDIRWMAYMLATIKRECADTWLPIGEYGKGKGRKYGVPDPHNGKVFYGRGYVQLTWADNYKTMGKIIGVDLYNEPDLAMVPENAYKIMSHGMRKGSFTGVGLPKYINTTKCDYVNARRIINGTDVADMIACFAKILESMLKDCEVKTNEV